MLNRGLCVQTLVGFLCSFLNTGSVTHLQQLAILQTDATSALTNKMLSVTRKSAEWVAGGDARNYVSLPPYAWPDPDRPGSWVRLDGIRNPLVDQIPDKANWNTLADDVQTVCHRVDGACHT